MVSITCGKKATRRCSEVVLKVTILGLDHETQWLDPTGDLREMLKTLFAQSRPELVAEEAHKLPTTVAQRLASAMDIAWLNVDMNDSERELNGISANVRRSPVSTEDGSFKMCEFYNPVSDGLREQHWIDQIKKASVASTVLICGALHLDPVAQKLRECGYEVDQVKVWEYCWYKTHRFDYAIKERDGDRWCEPILR